ncbi:MAG: hypothetical protein L6Q76_06550 [Polyangiaceae bacterium]|nr:hypothetical protein [Polyangiaceae bacterium]
MRSVLLLGLLGLLPLSGCCRCAGSVPVMFKSPPEDVIREKVALELKTDKHVATTACGVDATGLQDVKVTIGEGDFGGVGTVKIEGKPIGAAKAVVCTAGVTYVLKAVTNDDGDIIDWKVKSLDVKEVSTPGVKFTPPPPSDLDFDD